MNVYIRRISNNAHNECMLSKAGDPIIDADFNSNGEIQFSIHAEIFNNLVMCMCIMLLSCDDHEKIHDLDKIKLDFNNVFNIEIIICLMMGSKIATVALCICQSKFACG